MGVKLIILLGLLVGLLYCIHILVQDYQAVTAPRLLRLLFKRDLNSSNYSKPTVHWRRILYHDPMYCARYLYCELGAQPPDNEVRQGFIFMLTLKPRDEDKSSLEVFKKAYEYGRFSKEEKFCRNKYSTCPFEASLLFQLINYLLHTQQKH